MRNYHHKIDRNDEEVEVRERSYEEERIGKILLFQENMMKKLEFMKT